MKRGSSSFTPKKTSSAPRHPCSHLSARYVKPQSTSTPACPLPLLLVLFYGIRSLIRLLCIILCSSCGRLDEREPCKVFVCIVVIAAARPTWHGRVRSAGRVGRGHPSRCYMRPADGPPYKAWRAAHICTMVASVTLH